MYQGNIQKVEAPILTSNEFPSISFEDVQTLVLQSFDHDCYVAYSEGGLQREESRFVIKAAQDTSATRYDTDIVLTFPLKPYSGTLWFASKNGANPTGVAIWTVSCGSGMY